MKGDFWFWNDLWFFNSNSNTQQTKDQLSNSSDILEDVYSDEVTQPWVKEMQQPAKSPVEPVKPEPFSEADFLGDKYAVDDDMPKTVSISATIFFRLCVPVLHMALH